MTSLSCVSTRCRLIRSCVPRTRSFPAAVMCIAHFIRLPIKRHRIVPVHPYMVVQIRRSLTHASENARQPWCPDDQLLLGRGLLTPRNMPSSMIVALQMSERGGLHDIREGIGIKNILIFDCCIKLFEPTLVSSMLACCIHQ